jgi:hypothetical protein
MTKTWLGDKLGDGDGVGLTATLELGVDLDNGFA